MTTVAAAYQALVEARAAWDDSGHEDGAADREMGRAEGIVETGVATTLPDLLAKARLIRDLAPLTGGVISPDLAETLVLGLERLCDGRLQAAGAMAR